MREGAKAILLMAPVVTLVGLNLWFDNSSLRQQQVINEQRMLAAEAKNTGLHNASTIQRNVNSERIRNGDTHIARLESDLAAMKAKIATLESELATLRAVPPKAD